MNAKLISLTVEMLFLSYHGFTIFQYLGNFAFDPPYLAYSFNTNHVEAPEFMWK